MRMIFSALLGAALLFSACKNASKELSGNGMPEGLTNAEVTLSDLNCWVDAGDFYVVGLCSSTSSDWQRVWLAVQPLDKKGNPITINGAAMDAVPTHSEALPPQGKTSFIKKWPVSALSAVPDSFRVVGQGTLAVGPGPILQIENQKALKMLSNATNDTAGVQVELAWQILGLFCNTGQEVAQKPRLEVLVYGGDDKLCYSRLINPEEPEIGRYYREASKGPLAAGEKREINVNVAYVHMPGRVNKYKISRVELLPFNGR